MKNRTRPTKGNQEVMFKAEYKKTYVNVLEKSRGYNEKNPLPLLDLTPLSAVLFVSSASLERLQVR